MIGTALRTGFLKHAHLLAVHGRSVRWTFAELDRKSGALASLFASRGLGAGSVVPLLMRRSPALVLAQVAALRVGAAYASLDPDAPELVQLAALQLLNAKVVVTDGSLPLPAGGQYETIDLSGIDLDDFDSAAEWAECAHDALAYVTFTSGTTGAPKGVMIPHSGISRLVCDADYATFGAEDRWGFLSAPAFDASTLEVWGPLLNGGCCVVQETAQPSLDELASFILDNRLASVFLTSALFSAIMQHRPDAFRNLRQLIVGGERVSPQHARAALQAHPRLRLINGYGPTENTTFSTCHTITVADTEDPTGIPIGKAIRGTVVRIGIDAIDADEGELLTGGDGVALRYLGDDSLTATKFVIIDGTRWYRTGDLVRRRVDGVLEYRGRLDRQVKLQGHRIEIDAVESVLSACPGVGQCIVFVVGDTVMNRHLAACYTMTESAPQSTDAVILHMRAHLAPHAIPTVARELAAMPRTRNGKIDLSAIRAMFAHGPMDGSDDVAEFTTETELRLKEIWRQIFPVARIHRFSSFEQLGGTSMQALQLSAEVRRQLQRDLAPVDVIRAPVLRAQAALIDALRALPAERTHASSAYELTRLQQSILSAHALDASGCAYLVHVALKFDTGPDLSALREAFERLADHHPALRMRVPGDLASSLASNFPSLSAGWWCEQGALANWTDDALPEVVLRTINRPLHLTEAGVMRVDTWQLADTAVLCVWTVHHVAVDEASVDRCLTDIDLLLGGKPLVPVQQDPFSFAAFEREHTAHTATVVWPERLVEQLGNTAVALPRAPGAGTEIAVELPPNSAARFLEQCRRWGTTPFVPLLTTYARAVQAVFGREHAFVVTPFSRRFGQPMSDAVGCLLDLSLIEAGARPNESWAEQLARVHADASALQQTSFFPFEHIAEKVNRLRPGVAEHLTNFGFTWRLNPARRMMVGSYSATLLRVPQLGARFGMTMHCWMEHDELRCAIEMIDGGETAKLGPAVAKEFGENLALLFANKFRPDLARAASHQAAVALRPVAPNVMEGVRQAWMRHTDMSGIVLNDLSNFWTHGGNSLTALQMIAALERQFRIHIQPSEFFALPTLGNLWRLASAAGIQTDAVYVLIGAPDAKKLFLLFPGNHGSPLELYHLATHLERKLGVGHAVVIVDLEEIVRHAPPEGVFPFVLNRCVGLLEQLGRDRVVGLGGYSSGGIIALFMAAAYGANVPPVVWLLDTYKPFSKVSLAIRRVSRPAIGTLLRWPLLAKVAGTSVRGPRDPQPVHAVGSIAHVRQHAHEELSNALTPPPTGEVHLIQASETAREQLLLRNGGTNGFNPSYFAQGSVVRVEGAHSEIPSRLAEEVAEHIASSVTQRAPRAPSRASA